MTLVKNFFKSIMLITWAISEPTGKLSIFYLTVFLLSSVTLSNDCPCSMDSNDFGSTDPSTSSTKGHVSPQDHMDGDQSIGKLVAVGDVIMTQKNYVVKLSTRSFEFENGEDCPRGFRRMSLGDLETIRDNVKGEDFPEIHDPDIFNFPTGAYVFTTERPDDPETKYSYMGANISTRQTEIEIRQVATWISNVDKYMKCVMDSFPDNGGTRLPEDLVLFKAYDEDITDANAIDYHIEFSDGSSVAGNPAYTLQPLETGCFTHKIKKKMFNGTVIAKCLGSLVRRYYGSDADTTLAKSDVREYVFDGKLAERNRSLHFTYATAPMAGKYAGGAYLLYSVQGSYDLHVLEVDNDIDQENDFDLGVKGFPMAIADTEDGFVVYYRDGEDRNKSTLASFDKAGARKWRKVVMDNGDEPQSDDSQIRFHKEDGKKYFGMQAMYRPHNGQLVVGRNRIALIFSHYNNFDAGTGGVDGHTGDTTVSWALDGSDGMLGTAWDTSHSLTQRLVYDGLQFATSALGDAFPQQITFSVFDGKHKNGYVDGVTKKPNRFDHSSKGDLIPGTIPGNGTGKACGKLGGLHVSLSDRFEKYVQVYSRVPCTVDYGNIQPNGVDEAAVITFDREMNVLENRKFLSGRNINVIKSAKYGKNTFVLFSKSERDSSSQYEPNNYREDEDSCHMLLLEEGFSGSQASRVIDLDKYIVNNDNPVTLSDGNVAWSFVGSDMVLKIYTLKRPASTAPSPPSGGGNTGGGSTGGGDNTGGGSTGGGNTGGDTSGNTGNDNGGDNGGSTGGDSGNDTGGDNGGDTGGADDGGDDDGNGDDSGGDGDTGGDTSVSNPHVHVHSHPYTDPNHTHHEMILKITAITTLALTMII